MTDAELRALAEKATAGPWEADKADDDTCASVLVTMGRNNRIVAFREHPNFALETIRDEDDWYIAAVSPEVVISLLDRLAAAEKRLKWVQQISDGRRALMVCYRLGTQKGADAAITRIEKAEAALAALDGKWTYSLAEDRCSECGHGWGYGNMLQPPYICPIRKRPCTGWHAALDGEEKG